MKPVINVTPEKLVVKEGDDAQFSCTVEAGNPAPEVRRINVLFVIQACFLVIIMVTQSFQGLCSLIS